MAVKTASRKNSKVAAVEQIKTDEVFAKVKEMTPKGVGAKLSVAQAEISAKFAEISAKLIDQVTELDTIQKAIELKQLEMKELYNLESTAVAAAALEDHISTLREQWTREKAIRDQQWLDDETQWAKETEREESEWDYDFSQSRKQKEQALEEDLAAKKKNYQLAVEAVEKNMAERQEKLVAAEKDLANLRAQEATFESRVTRDTAAQVASATAAIKRQFEHEKALVEKDRQSAVSLSDQRVAAMQADCARLQQQLAQAYDTMDKLREDNKSISTAAFQSVSGQQALAAVTSAQRQENNLPVGKSGR